MAHGLHVIPAHLVDGMKIKMGELDKITRMPEI